MVLGVWLTERHFRKELEEGSLQLSTVNTELVTTYMVDDVVMSDIVEEKSPLPAQKVSISRCSGSTLEVPLFLAIMWEMYIGVLEVGDHSDCTKNQRRITCVAEG